MLCCAGVRQRRRDQHRRRVGQLRAERLQAADHPQLPAERAPAGRRHALASTSTARAASSRTRRASRELVRALADAGDRAEPAHRLRQRRGDREEGAPRRHARCARRRSRWATSAPSSSTAGCAPEAMIGPDAMKRRRSRSCAGPLRRLPQPGARRGPVSSAGCSGASRSTGARPSHVFGTIHDRRRAARRACRRRCAARSTAPKSLMLEFVPNAYSRERFSRRRLFLRPPDAREAHRQRGFRARAGAARADRPAARSRQQAEALGRAAQPARPAAAERRATPARRASSSSAAARAAPAARPDRRRRGADLHLRRMPDGPQVALLRHSLAHRDELLALAERTLDAYLARDLPAIWRLREHSSRAIPKSRRTRRS